jgi:hypothetical protein
VGKHSNYANPTNTQRNISHCKSEKLPMVKLPASALTRSIIWQFCCFLNFWRKLKATSEKRSQTSCRSCTHVISVFILNSIAIRRFISLFVLYVQHKSFVAEGNSQFSTILKSSLKTCTPKYWRFRCHLIGF